MGATEHARAGAVIDGKYRVDEVIGAGGMGVVVAAQHVTLGTRVAIKLVRPARSREAHVAIARFEREARIASTLLSEHVARVEDMGTLPDGTPYMVMDHLQGRDLRKLLAERGPLPLADCVEYVRQACIGVAEAHAAGIVHRDLNPSNLFLAQRPDGSSIVKVLDFGIARLTHDVASPSLTASALLLGSVHYMSPEQMRSARTVDARSDVWSLGAILHELVTGAPAFGGETMPETCAAVIFRPARPLSELRPNVPARLQAIVSTCLAKRREDRYPSADALARDLGRLGRELDLGVMDTVRPESASSLELARTIASDAPPSFAPRAASSRSVAPLAMTPPYGQRAKKGKRTWWAWIAGVEAVALVVVALAFATQWRTHWRGAAASAGEGNANANANVQSAVAASPRVQATAPVPTSAAPAVTASPALLAAPREAAKARVASVPIATPEAAPREVGVVDAGPPEPTAAPSAWPWGDRK